MTEGERRRLVVLKTMMAASILSTAIHYTDNFIAVDRYQGLGGNSDPTAIRVAIVLAWPLLTWIGLIGYRRYRERRYQEAYVSLAVYSLTGLSTFGHFIYGSPAIPPFFYATLFTDGLTGLCLLGFVVWSAIAVAPARPSAKA
ncbi:MAG TPA: hypothetical protein VGY30_06705 [Solirubrobacteraceae bacterium]|jgi:hypothetical protein|nr:hypothetical protein [Solirubrobacteraceae bacterium]